MATEHCGVRVRQQEPHFNGWRLNVGHQWIEFVDGSGNTTFSAGFWPSGSFMPWTDGTVHSPDPYHGDTSAKTYSVEISLEQGWESDIDDCANADCDAIRECIEFAVSVTSASPRKYSLFLNNCRHWVSNVLSRCCLSK